MRMTEDKPRRIEEGIEEGKEDVKKVVPFTKPTLRGSHDGSPPKVTSSLTKYPGTCHNILHFSQRSSSAAMD